MTSRLPRITARQGAALMAIGLTVLLVLELSLGSNISGPFWANYLVGVPLTAAVAWRRRWPVYALSAQLLLAIASTAGDGDLTQNTVAPFFAVILVAYGVGAYPPRRWDEAGLVIGVVGMALVNIAGAADAASDYIGTELLAIIGPWFAGRAAREWAQQARELERVNRALKAEQEQRSLLAVADERSRIARELHDVVAHSI